MAETSNGTSKGQTHYINSAKQPVEVMQLLFTQEQFLGFLIGNYIKYKMRAGNKGDKDKDLNKARQYAYWYVLAKDNKMIDPIKDTVPSDFVFKGLIQ